MTDALLFLHLLSATAPFAAVVVFSAVALGARMEPGGVTFSPALGVLLSMQSSTPDNRLTGRGDDGDAGGRALLAELMR